MENKKLIDTHAHLLKGTFPNELDLIIENNLAKLDLIFNIAWDLSSSEEVIALNQKYQRLLPVIGIHPNDIEGLEIKPTIDALEQLILNHKVYAVGEIGIDLFRSEANSLKPQQLFFAQQLELASKYNLPVVLHIRDAYEEALVVLKQYPQVKLLVHSWNSTIETLEKYLSLPNDVYFGINGIATFKNAIEVNGSLTSIPLDKLVIETDAPWLTPTPKRSVKPNQPFYVEYVFDYLVAKLNLEESKLREILITNAKDFFNFES